MDIKKDLNIFQLLGKTSLLEFSIFLLIFFLFILNEGIALIKFPFTPIPIVEGLISIAFLIYLAIDKQFFNIIKNSKFTIPYLILFISTSLGTLFNLGSYGILALRTATHIFDLSVLFIGLKFGESQLLRKVFYKIFVFSLFIGSLYMLTFPFKEYLIIISPQIENLRGTLVPILFNFTTTPLISINFLAYYIFKPKIPFKSLGFLISIISVFITIFIFSKRTDLLNLFLLIITYLLINKNKLNLKLLSPLILIVLGFFLLSSLEINFWTENMKNLSYLKRFFLSGFKFLEYKPNEELILLGEVSGANERLLWWSSGIQKIITSPFNFLFGIGQGIPLTDLVERRGAVVTELHNSYLTILIRNGFIGFVSFIYIQWNIFSSVWSKYIRANNELVRSTYITFLYFLVSINVFSLFQPAFEKPYFAIPYYFFSGIVISKTIKKRKFNIQ